MNDNVDLLVRSGWAVQITRKDGTTFLSSSGIGTHPAVWCKSNRKWAVKHKRELLLEGFRCKVVHVKFADPQVERPNARLDRQEEAKHDA